MNRGAAASPANRNRRAWRPSWLSGAELLPGPSLSVAAYETLRESIVTGLAQPGELLNEPSIAEHFRMSRTPVREAMLRLRDDGLIVIRRQAGTYVAPLDISRVEQGMIVREALEPTLVSLAATRMSKTVLAKLTDQTDTMQAAMTNKDSRLFIRADNFFHELLVDGSGHQHIAQIIRRVNAPIDRMRYLSVSEPVRSMLAIDEHRQLIKQLADGNGTDCAELLRQHLRGSWVMIRQQGVAVSR